uniref:J domain-containing protein n=1 Tax=Fibrocapsa japonica TaxID=94617 RepID=A0A7S2UW86_9STRA
MRDFFKSSLLFFSLFHCSLAFLNGSTAKSTTRVQYEHGRCSSIFITLSARKILAEEPKLDYYRILGVDKKADTEEIQQAYRTLARTCHPDLNKDDPKAVEAFRVLNTAYTVLRDPKLRSSYDAGVAFDQFMGIAEEIAVEIAIPIIKDVAIPMVAMATTKVLNIFSEGFTSVKSIAAQSSRKSTAAVENNGPFYRFKRWGSIIKADEEKSDSEVVVQVAGDTYVQEVIASQPEREPVQVEDVPQVEDVSQKVSSFFVGLHRVEEDTPQAEVQVQSPTKAEDTTAPSPAPAQKPKQAKEAVEQNSLHPGSHQGESSSEEDVLEKPAKKPRRPSGWQTFQNEQRPILQATGLQFGQISVKLGKLWKAKSNEEKQYYQDTAMKEWQEKKVREDPQVGSWLYQKLNPNTEYSISNTSGSLTSTSSQNYSWRAEDEMCGSSNDGISSLYSEPSEDLDSEKETAGRFGLN